MKDLTKYEISTSNVENWIHPHNSFLHVKGKILKADGSNLTGYDILTIKNNGFNLFDRAKYYIEDKEIENVRLATTVMNFVDFSDDFARSVANNMFCYKDTAEPTGSSRFLYDASDKSTLVKELNVKIENLIPKIKKNHNFNKAYLERLKLTKQTKQVRIFGKTKEKMGKDFSLSITYSDSS